MVSIVIPTYNRGNVIEKSIKSILEQSYKNFELLIIDDNSTDNTYSKIMGIDDARIRYIKSNKRLGANGARNIGIQNAKGEYIAFQDSDDVWEKDKLVKQMNFLEQHEEIDVVFCRYMYYFINGEQRLVPSKIYSGDKLRQKISDTLAQGNVIGTPTMIAKKKCFDESGMFDEAIPRFQDWEIAIRFAQKYQFGFIDEVMVKAYESKESISRSRESQIDGWALILKKHKDFFEERKTLKKHLGKLLDLTLEEKKLERVMDILGNELFQQGLYANYIKNCNIKKNFIFLQEWVKKENSSVALNRFCSKYADKTIALYGLGEIGKLVLNILSDDNRQKIKFIIDQNSFILCDYEIKTLNDLQYDDFKDLECILITAIAHEEEIKNNIKEMMVVPTVSLYDIIWNCKSGQTA